jgi:hypothetical protein
MAKESSYIPGVCNINPKEVAYRRRVGQIGLAIFVILLVALMLIHVTHLLRVVLLLPAFVSAIGYLQAKNHFCVAYGGSGQENATTGSAKANKVTDNTAIAADKKRTRQINLQAAGLAVLATIIAIVLPHI